MRDRNAFKAKQCKSKSTKSWETLELLRKIQEIPTQFTTDATLLSWRFALGITVLMVYSNEFL